MSRISIGDGAVVGAHSVVTKNVEPYSVVAGVILPQVRWRGKYNFLVKRGFYG